MADQQPPAPPPYIDPNPGKDQAGAALRDILILVGALPSLVAVFGTHDVGQIVAYLQSTQFAPALGVVIVGGTFIWRQIVTRGKKKEVVAVAKAPDPTPVLTSTEAKEQGLK